jgi:hypothetical protein
MQLAALRQQIASLRAENLALRTALGGDKEAAAVMAAAGRGSVGSTLFDMAVAVVCLLGSALRTLQPRIDHKHAVCFRT